MCCPSPPRAPQTYMSEVSDVYLPYACLCCTTTTIRLDLYDLLPAMIIPDENALGQSSRTIFGTANSMPRSYAS